MNTAAPNPAIFYAPDGYAMDGPRLMGRQAAGAGFLRAAVENRGGGPMRAVVNTPQAAQAFRATVLAADPQAPVELIARNDLESLARCGTFYWPDVNLGPRAWQRLRLDPAAYSLCAVTHTISSNTAMGMLANHLFEPIMPWDALICTSRTAAEVVNRVYDEADAQHRWRARVGGALPRPRTPVIPLGVHSGDFLASAQDRAAARAGLGLAEDEVVVFAPGRLAAAGKANPFQTLTALQAVAEAGGAHIALVFAGQAEAQRVLDTYRSSAAKLAPAIRTLFVDGKDAAAYGRAWAAGDIFISLADSIQETFGLTPIEAMSAGLPCVVSDWDGYKDTVRDGVDGFRIATWTQAPYAGAADRLAHDFELEALDPNHYHYRANASVSVDPAALRARLARLVADPDLRRRMGEAGRARARELYDWKVVYGRYRELWTGLAAIRARAAADPMTRAWLAQAPRRSPAYLGPFDAFETYPTHHVTGETVVAVAAGATPAGYQALIEGSPLSHWRIADEVFERMHAALADGPLPVATLAERTGYSGRVAIEIVARLAKAEVVILGQPGG